MTKTEVLHILQDRRLEETRLRLPEVFRGYSQSEDKVCQDQGSARGDVFAHSSSLPPFFLMDHVPRKHSRITTGGPVVSCDYPSTGTEKQPRERSQLGRNLLAVGLPSSTACRPIADCR